MSASLDKSLDDIISSNKKSFKSKRPGAKFGAKGVTLLRLMFLVYQRT